ncbi:MAG: HAD family hydrolase, partial [Deltaproteobacteria bacterium]|nr:HAD family hydrolase [Deltaproteobacteria bacterium]
LGFEKDLTFFSCNLGCAKPSRIIFNLAVKSLKRKKIAPGTTLYVGNDMLNDIYPAARAGMKTALFAGDARSLRLRTGHRECHGLSADLVVTGLMQIPALIRAAGQD